MMPGARGAFLGRAGSGRAGLLLSAGPAHSADWGGWSQSSTLGVQNNVSTTLPAGYTVTLALDT